MKTSELNKELGNVDIYLLDQILKERFEPGSRILDAGCGEGRNLTYFLRNNFEVFGVDQEAMAIKMLRMWARSISEQSTADNFQVGDITSLNFPAAVFDAVISSAVLHFAKNLSHFHEMIAEMVRVLKAGGTLFLRMTSNIGLKDHQADGDLHKLADGSTRFLLTEQLIEELATKYKLEKLEPHKHVSVEGRRVMSTLVLTKGQ